MNPQVQAIIYLLCFATSVGCAWLLARSYIRSRARLLLWTSLCFGFLALNNLFVVADLVIFPHIDFRLWRHAAAVVAVSVLLFGFIWEQE